MNFALLNLVLFGLFLFLCVAGSALTRKLTWPAALVGGFLAIAIFFGVEWAGIALMATFFLLGTLATSHKKYTKQSLGIAQENKSGRTVGQVLANGGAAGLLGLFACVFPQQAPLFLMLMAAAFSSATADTVSSELGSAYGRKFYDILTFKKGRRGDDGVVSVEGFLFGLAGSAVIAAVYAAFDGWNLQSIWILVAGTFGNLADSYLGASLERKGILKNDAVNLLNTIIAALVALALQNL